MSAKAKGYSISFRPAWLYGEAVKYGAHLTDEHGNPAPQNVSEIVCGFVRAGLTAAGWPLPDDGARARRVLIQPDLARALKEARKLGIDPVAALRDRIAQMSQA